MFGYVKPDLPYLYIKDETLYNALYCQTCKSIGKKCGQCARFSLTYDIAFMSAMVHNIKGVDVKISREHCVAHVFKRRPIADRTEISDALGELIGNLANYKAALDKGDRDAMHALLAEGNARKIESEKLQFAPKGKSKC